MHGTHDIARHIWSSMIPVMAAAFVVGPTLGQPARQQDEGAVVHEQVARGVARPEVLFLRMGAIVDAAISSQGANGEVEDLGRISDLLVDTDSGGVQAAILAVGEKRAAVEWQSLVWDPRNARFTTTMSRQKIEGLPQFTGLDGADAGEATPLAKLVLASEIAKGALVADADRLGPVGMVFVDPATGTVAFVSVAVGGLDGIGAHNYVIPWTALRPVRVAGGERLQLRLDKSKAALELAPRLEDADANIDQVAFRERIYTFYGASRPAFDAAARDEPKVTKRKCQ